MLNESALHVGIAADDRHAMPLASAPRFAEAIDSRFGNVLDQIDYGLLLVGADMGLSYANRAALSMLAAGHPLCRFGAGVTAHCSAAASRLRAALLDAQRGLRTLLVLDEGGQRACVAVVPLKPVEAHAHEALLVVGKRAVCEELSAQWYARSCGLTMAETKVLDLLCAGVLPREIARRQSVAISTVRTQINSIRSKTGARTVASLMRDVAVLPPIVHALHPAMEAH